MHAFPGSLVRTSNHGRLAQLVHGMCKEADAAAAGSSLLAELQGQGGGCTAKKGVRKREQAVVAQTCASAGDATEGPGPRVTCVR